MNNETISRANAAVIEILGADPGCMIGLGALLDELGTKRPGPPRGCSN
jgi:hypothetical protein